MANSPISEISNYTKLEIQMLQGIDPILDKLCQKSIELEHLGKEIIQKEDIFERICIYANKDYIYDSPDYQVYRIYNHLFLVSNFKQVLPKNAIAVQMMKNKGTTIFVMKKIDKYNTVIELPVGISNLSSKLQTSVDLISYQSNCDVWCLIKNYVRDPKPNKNTTFHLSTEKTKFVKYKLVVLKNLIKENKLSMEALIELKKELRAEIYCA